MMLPYIEFKGYDKWYRSSSDLVILDQDEIVFISLIGSKEILYALVDKIKKGIEMQLKDRNDPKMDIKIKGQDRHDFYYKSEVLKDDVYHLVLYDKSKMNDVLINWKNENIENLLVDFFIKKKQLPVNQEIVLNALELDQQHLAETKFLKTLKVYTNQDSLMALKAHKIDVEQFENRMSSIPTPSYKNDCFDWNNVQNIKDYILTFSDVLKNKIVQHIDVLFDENDKLPEILYKSKKVPYSGQVPLIGSGIEILKKDKFVYLGGEQGVGKTGIFLKIAEGYYHTVNKSNPCIFILCPKITMKEWEESILDFMSNSNDIQVYKIKSTSDFIQLYEKTSLEFNQRTFILCSKETFKLQYDYKPIYEKIRKKVVYEVGSGKRIFDFRKIDAYLNVLICKECRKPLIEKHDYKGDIFLKESDFKTKSAKNSKCYYCHSPLWSAVYKKTKKTSVIDYIKKRKIKFDMVMIDEMQEQNNEKSLIGNYTKTLLRNHCKKAVLLSGTPNNGYASSLYNVIAALMPRKLELDNIYSERDFVKRYGTLECVVPLEENQVIKNSQYNEVEGINPLVFTKYLSQNFISASLIDIADHLPPLKEYYVDIEPNEPLKNVALDFRHFLKNNGAAFLTSTLLRHFENNPFNWKTVTLKEESYQPIYKEDGLLPKEKKLIEILKSELKENRKCMIYIEFNDKGSSYLEPNTHLLSVRLINLLKEQGIKVFYLDRNTCKAEDRKNVLTKASEEYSVFMCNRNLISVGINLQFCSTYINYIPSFMVNLVEQANRRGWRANTSLENRVYNLYYKGLYEEEVIEKYQRKKVESTAIIGKLNISLNKEEIRTISRNSQDIFSYFKET